MQGTNLNKFKCLCECCLFIVQDSRINEWLSTIPAAVCDSFLKKFHVLLAAPGAYYYITAREEAEYFLVFCSPQIKRDTSLCI